MNEDIYVEIARLREAIRDCVRDIDDMEGGESRHYDQDSNIRLMADTTKHILSITFARKSDLENMLKLKESYAF